MEAVFLIALLVVVGGIVAGVVAHKQEQEALSRMSSTERAVYLQKKRDAAASATWGPPNHALVCPHCQARGKVRTKNLMVKKGISGAKATGAVLTGGVSLLATGLSRKEATTQAHCDNCNSTWLF
jgi:hypothetical protein